MALSPDAQRIVFVASDAGQQKLQQHPRRQLVALDRSRNQREEHVVCLGRTGSFSTEAQEWFITKVRGLRVESRPPAPILMGRHLLEMGLQPGPAVGRITRAVYEMQLDGKVATLEEARREARGLLAAGTTAGTNPPDPDRG